KDSADAPAGLAVSVNVVEELGADGYVYGSAEAGVAGAGLGAAADLVDVTITSPADLLGRIGRAHDPLPG
ncbi:hypothetical protein AB0A67_34440, partial [Streptomyces eurythermus]